MNEFSAVETTIPAFDIYLITEKSDEYPMMFINSVLISYSASISSVRSEGYHNDVGGGAVTSPTGSTNQKLLRARRGSGHNISFKQNRSFKMKRGGTAGK